MIESSIRPIALGRKDWINIGSPEAGSKVAAIVSVIESCRRGDTEKRIKAMQDLEIDRISCSSFWANQLRVLLTAAAYVLMQELRLRAAGTACARAQVLTLRERLLKLGARIMGSVRRFVIPCQRHSRFCLRSNLPLGRPERINLHVLPFETSLVALLAQVCHHLSKFTFHLTNCS